MAAIDYQTTESVEGEFDIVMPLTKITDKADILFQQVDLLLNTYLKEFLYDTTMGMPYDDILGKNFDLTQLETIYYDKISVLIYFKEFLDFQIDIDEQRSINISFTVVAEDNTTQTFTQGL